MPAPSTTRRELLGRGAGAVAAAATATAAGCLAGFRPPAYESWLPTPEAIGAPHHYPFEAYDLAALTAREDAFAPAVDHSTLAVGWEPAPFEPRDVSRFVRTNDVVLVDADVDRRATREAFETNGFEVVGDRADHVLLSASDGSAGVAVGDGSFVGAGLAFAAVDDARRVLAAVVDAIAGRGPRYVEARSELDAALNALDDGHYVTATTRHPPDEGTPADGVFAGEVARGRRWTVDGATTTGRWVRVFETPSDVPVAAVRAWLDAARDDDSRLEPFREFTVEASGRVAVVDAVADTAAL